MQTYKVDAVDLEILNLLQANGRLAKSKIAQSVNLSEVPCWRRVKHLEEVGIISSYIALVDKEKMGYQFQAFISLCVDMSNEEALHEFRTRISCFPEVLGFYNVTGEYDYLLQVVTKDVKHFRDFIDENLRGMTCIEKMFTTVVLNAIKEEHNIALSQQNEKTVTQKN
jgi:DNA-binding Lrp family transcriptional regulator